MDAAGRLIPRLLLALLALTAGCRSGEEHATDNVFIIFGIIFAIGAAGTIVSIFRTEAQVLGPLRMGGAPERVSCFDAFEKIRFLDTNFSIALFEDFLTELFLEAHRRRGSVEALSELDAHLSGEVRRALHARAPEGTRVAGLRIGSLRYLRFEGLFDPDAREMRLTVELTALGREIIPRWPDRDLYLRERWTLLRSKEASTPMPSKIAVDRCPACGAPRKAGDEEGRCGHCGERVDTGERDWIVISVEVIRQRRSPPRPALSSSHATVLPMVQKDIAEREPYIDLPGIQTKAAKIVEALQRAFESGDLDALRPLCTDAGFDAVGYWLDALARRGDAFPLADMVLEHVQLSAATFDRWFFSATVRIHALVPKEMREERRSIFSFEPAAYSAYWTFIRGRFRGPHRDDACPWCGAALEIVMGAVCEYCGAVVDKRAFGWLLSRMESTRAYHDQWIYAGRGAPHAPDKP